MRGAIQGQSHGKGRTRAFLALHGRATAVALDDNAVGEGQAFSRAFARGLGSEEGLEHLGLHGRAHARAVVGDLNLHLVVQHYGAHAHLGLVARPRPPAGARRRRRC